MLAFLQIGDFPFDHTENVDPNTAAAYMEVWLQQIRNQFTELPHIQEKVAKEVRLRRRYNPCVPCWQHG